MNSANRDCLGKGLVYFLVSLFIVICFTGYVANPVKAVISGSKHNFSGKAFSLNGSCSACHLAHGAQDGKVLWSRDLSQEEGSSGFKQNADPDYIPYFTVLCYDCHIDATNFSPTPDDDPSDWTSGNEPQDIAFQDGPPPGTETGYYELADGTLPSGGTDGGPRDGSPTGGHYWMTEPTGTPDFERGDKLACIICHDPHDKETGTGLDHNQAMIRTTTSNGVGGTIDIGVHLQASGNTRNGDGDGREICAGCHGLNDSGTQKELWGVTVPKPPPFTEHTLLNTVPCTNCHRHNFITASCVDCHGYPPPVEHVGGNYANIDETLGPHPLHANEIADSAYGFECKECHFNYPVNHNTGTLPPPVGYTYQNVNFDTANKNPTATYTTASRNCNNLYCHSRGTSINDTQNASGVTSIQWTGDAVNNWSANNLSCNACHGNTASAEGDTDYGAPGYTNGAPKTNSHNRHLYPCSYCHYNITRDSDPAEGWDFYVDAVAPENYGRALHVNNTIAGFTYNVDPGPNPCDGGNPYFDSYTYAATGGTCTNIDCHGGQPATWGDTMDCTDCHYRNTASGGDDDNFGFPAAFYDCTVSQINSDEWLTTGHGRPGAGPAEWYGWPDRRPDRDPGNFTGCVSSQASEPVSGTGCHSADVPHGTDANPYRLATYDVITYAFQYPPGTTPGSLDLFCHHCHSDAFDKTHSQAITGGDNWGDPPGAPTEYKCIDCHDAHGDSPDFMVHANVFASSSNSAGDPVTTGLGIQPVSPSVIIFDPPQSGGQQSDYVNLAAGSDIKICQVCHQSNSYFTRTTTASHYPGVDCMDCHKHDTGFQATACDACHGDPPYDPGGGDAVAPDVLTYWDGSWWDTNQGGADTVQQGGHGDPDGEEGGNVDLLPQCKDCHDISVPIDGVTGKTTHLDGILNSAETGLNTNENTAHIKPGVDVADPGFFLPVTSVASGPYNIQVTFDNYCYSACHQGIGGIDDMRHERDTAPADGNHWSVEFNTHLTIPDGSVLSYPVDIDVSTDAPAGPPHYAPCVSCHNPHGTGTLDVRGNFGNSSNKMLRDDWQNQNSTICKQCHP